jgi:hypothetical protein
MSIFPVLSTLKEAEMKKNIYKIIAVAASFLPPDQAFAEDMPQDKEVIAFIKNNKRIDFRKTFPSDWEAIWSALNNPQLIEVEGFCVVTKHRKIPASSVVTLTLVSHGRPFPG